MAAERTILIIDDDNESREVVREALEGKDYTFLEASSGEEAMELFSMHDIDVVTVILCYLERMVSKFCGISRK